MTPRLPPHHLMSSAQEKMILPRKRISGTKSKTTMSRMKRRIRRFLKGVSERWREATHVSRITRYPRAITQTTLSVRGASGSLVKTHSCSHAYMKFRQHSKQLSFSDMFLYHFVLFDIVCLYFMVFIIYYVIIIQMLLSQ